MIEPRVFLVDIVRYGVDFVERKGRMYNNGRLLEELRRYIDGKYIVYGDVDYFLLPIWERIMFELNSGFDRFGTRFIPSVNFNLDDFVEEACSETPEYWGELRIEYRRAA